MADGKQIFEWFQSGRLDPLEFARVEIEGLIEEFHQDADGLRVADNDMQANWEGEAADGASKGIGPLIEGHLQSLGLIEDTASSTQSQADLYAQSKNSVVPVPDAPEEPSMWARGASAVMPGVPDPMESYRDGMNSHNDANANNVRVMDQYGAGTGQTRSQLPSDFGIMEDDGAALTIGTTSASAVGTPTSGAPTFGGPGGGLSGGSSSGVGGFGPGPSVNAPGPIGGGPSPGGVPSPTPGGAPPGIVPGPGGNPPVRPGPGMPIVGPVGGPPGSSENERRAGRTATGRPAAGSSRAGARMTGGAPGSGKATSILRGGPGAGAQARLSGGTAGLQAGKGAGVLSGGGPGAAAAAKAAGGLGGRAGAGGMGAAGAGGARGKGEEDGEHTDKYAIKEELDDGLQVEYDELGAKTIDDKTGHTVVSPVIGDPDYVPGSDEKPKD